MDKKKVIPLAIGVLCAVIATYAIIAYLRQQEEILREDLRREFALQQDRQISVFTAARDIPAGTVMTPDLVEERRAPRERISPDAVRYFSQIQGAKTLVALRAQDIIREDMVEFVRRDPQRLSSRIPDDKRAVSVAPNNIDALIGLVRPGDRVDVRGIVPVPTGERTREVIHVPLFQNVLVLAVGKDFGDLPEEEQERSRLERFFTRQEEDPEEVAERPPRITLALGPKEVGIVSFVEENGKINLFLRGDVDAQVRETPSLDWGSFYHFLISRGAVPVPHEPKTVDIYRGERRERMEIQP